MSVKIVNETEITCPHCQSKGVMKYGTYKGVQRYMCKSCQRKFKADDTVFHGKLDANLVSSALNMYYEGMSVKEVRRHLLQEHEHAPSTATIYEWIMKYTQYAVDSVGDTKPKVGNNWIADETVIEIDGQNCWLWDIIDDKFRGTEVSHCMIHRIDLINPETPFTQFIESEYRSKQCYCVRLRKRELSK